MRSVRNIAHPENLPELGTKEAAVESCASLIAGMAGQPEAIMHYWLDLYYQVRLAYEIEEEQRRRREGVKLDAEQFKRTMDALRRMSEGAAAAATAEGDTQDAEKEAPAPEAPAEGEAAGSAEAGEEAGAERSAPPPGSRRANLRASSR